MRAAPSSAPFVLRGAQTREELDIANFTPLAQKWAWRYRSVLGGYDEAVQEAFVGLCKAREAWEPKRGPFEAIAAWYVRSHLDDCAERAQKDAGVPVQERVRGKHVHRKTGRVEERVALLSSNVESDDGGEIDLLENIPDDAPDPEERLSVEQRDALVHEALGELNGSGADLRRLLAEDAPIADLRRAATALTARELGHLRERTEDFAGRHQPWDLPVARGHDPLYSAPQPEPGPRPPSRPKKPQQPYEVPPAMWTGKFVRDGSIRATILRLLAEGTHTAEEICARSGAGSLSNTTSHIYCLCKRDLGAGYGRDEDGAYYLLLPKGRKLEDLIRPGPRRPTTGAAGG